MLFDEHSSLSEIDVSYNNIELFYHFETFRNLLTLKVSNNFYNAVVNNNYGTYGNSNYNTYTFTLLAEYGVKVYINDSNYFVPSPIQIQLRQALSPAIYQKDNNYQHALSSISNWLTRIISTNYTYTTVEMAQVAASGRPHAMVLSFRLNSGDTTTVYRVLLLS